MMMMMNDEWWLMNDEWWMMNDEWWMMNDDDDDGDGGDGGDGGGGGGGGAPLSREKSRDVLEQPPQYLLKQEDSS